LDAFGPSFDPWLPCLGLAAAAVAAAIVPWLRARRALGETRARLAAAEAAAARLDALLRDLIEAQPGAAALLDADGREWASNAAARAEGGLRHAGFDRRLQDARRLGGTVVAIERGADGAAIRTRHAALPTGGFLVVEERLPEPVATRGRAAG
jgi:type II secretory pathway pseudopilin PulG